ncbi:hypothetical protein RRG08_007699 [Elysia crispata]|uniref:Uncharacterized protein n=1 Tax=Elysia crispata TaxID=231223 RepID=A0AAE0YTT4_9GAST|nr:hypothetical protein RRG08_007699 [Elysia crispata]
MVTPHLPLTPQTLVMKRPMHNCTLPTLVKKLHQLRLLCTTADGKEDIAKDNAAQSARQEMPPAGDGLASRMTTPLPSLLRSG